MNLAEVLHEAGLLIFLSSILFNPQVLFRTTYIFTYNLRFQCLLFRFFSFCSYDYGTLSALFS